jgi:TIR domain
MAKIIVSYRRADSAAISGRIFDRLAARYGEDSVFMDVDNIPFGTDFRTHIRDELLRSDMLVAVIGPRWLGVGAEGKSRISDESDPVRVEVETALTQGIPVLPVLIDGAAMPSAEQLPPSLKDLAFINAAPVDAGRDFRAHMDRLIRSMDRILESRGTALTPAAASPAAPATTTLGASRARAGRKFASRLLWFAIPVASLTLAAVWFGIVPEFFAARPEAPVAPVRPTPPQPRPSASEQAVTPPEVPSSDRRGETPVPTPIPPAVAPDRGPEISVAENQPPATPTPAARPAAPLPAGPPVAAGPAAPPPVPAAVPASPPTATYRVLPSVSEGKLNMRAGPGTKHPLVTAIPAGATGLTVGRCRMPDDGGAKPWCEATWRSFAGWVSSCCVVDEKTGAFPK